MLIVQISDPHIAVPGEKAYGIAPTDEYLARCVEHINQLDPRPDVALVTGDITNEGGLGSAEHASRLLDKLQCPYYVIPGNHDDRSILRSVFGEKSCPSTDPDFIHYVIEGHEVRLIAIDSTKPGFPGGQICDARLQWLKQRLLEETHQPHIIFMHHPPVKCG
ncbi:MAG: metallophosphoesterase, partial [Rhizobiaceae bacterium]|nr:metallophosphoesterase [Rhizobiaceae bacterium]